MEKAIKKFAVLFALATLSISSVMASDIDVTVEGDKLIRLSINEISNGLVFKFKDAKQTIMYTEKISNTEYIKRIDLNQLPTGTYSIEIEDELKLRVVEVTVGDESVVLANVKTTLAKPSIVAGGNIVKMYMLPLSTEALKLSIYNAQNILVHSELLAAETEVRRVFDFSAPGAGDYRFVVKNENYNYSQVIEIK